MTLEIPGSRLVAGAAIFLAGFLSPLLIPLVMASGLSDGVRTVLSGLLMFGLPELGMVLAVVILGKSGFDYLKSRLLGTLASTLFPERVSFPRHVTGLILLCLPLVLAWAMPYAPNAWIDADKQYLFAIAGDIMLLTGLLLLGGEFWEKLRRLFLYNTPDISHR